MSVRLAGDFGQTTFLFHFLGNKKGRHCREREKQVLYYKEYKECETSLDYTWLDHVQGEFNTVFLIWSVKLTHYYKCR